MKGVGYINFVGRSIQPTSYLKSCDGTLIAFCITYISMTVDWEIKIILGPIPINNTCTVRQLLSDFCMDRYCCGGVNWEKGSITPTLKCYTFHAKNDLH